jgi:hypothetical protein
MVYPALHFRRQAPPTSKLILELVALLHRKFRVRQRDIFQALPMLSKGKPIASGKRSRLKHVDSGFDTNPIAATV